ncbi:hypothetical protein PHMEG_00027853 [Phytophthora megakarya]|uniref:Cysteine-rich protein n=1 Tax=Phytophthora megakarya TaxID=4795 RepID=A0A225V4M6_9STRA|nr:hypothetical protein PHMEG_00027853 [Phytophthora megakarya]
MKISAVLVIVATVVCLANPTASESEAHLRVHVEVRETCDDIKCSPGEFCTGSNVKCRAPDYSKGECFNVATGAFQTGCSLGFKCKNGKCASA